MENEIEKAIAKSYEPICSLCNDHGFRIVPYGVSGSGTQQCQNCLSRYVHRRKAFQKGYKAALAANTWVAIKDGLPPANKKVLVTLLDGFDNTTRTLEAYLNGNHNWCNFHNGCVLDDGVIAWMEIKPIPSYTPEAK